MTITLWDFQERGVDAIRAAYMDGIKAVLCESPTGSGKTVVASHVIGRTVAKGNKVLFLTHRRELIGQCSNKLDDNGIEHGIIAAGNPRIQPWQPVQIASVATLINRTNLPDADLIIPDEAHHAPSESFSNIIGRYPNARILGLTASPCRLDGRGLGIGTPGGFFQRIVRLATVSELIERGFLVAPRTFAPDAPALAGITKNAGDYNKGQLAFAMDKPRLVGDLVQTWLRLASGRTTVVFACSIDHSKHIVQRFREAGISAEHLDAKTPDGEREAILSRARSGETTVLSNVAILTEGWDLPRVSCVVMARPTLSLSLYLQMPGRGLRLWPGKTDCVILDHAGNSLRHGLVTDEREFSLDGVKKGPAGPKPPSHKTCPRCSSIVPAATVLCDRLHWSGTICGHRFVVRARVILETPGELRERQTQQRQSLQIDRRAEMLARWIIQAREAGHQSVAPYLKYRGYFRAPVDAKTAALAVSLAALPVPTQAEEEKRMEARG